MLLLTITTRSAVSQEGQSGVPASQKSASLFPEDSGAGNGSVNVCCILDTELDTFFDEKISELERRRVGIKLEIERLRSMQSAMRRVYEKARWGG